MRVDGESVGGVVPEDAKVDVLRRVAADFENACVPCWWSGVSGTGKGDVGVKGEGDGLGCMWGCDCGVWLVVCK